MELNRLKLPPIKIDTSIEGYMNYMGINDRIAKEIGIMNEERKQWSVEDGVEYVDKLLSDFPDAPVLHTYRSSIFLQGGDVEATIRSLQRSLEFMPNHLHIRLNLLKSYVQFQQWKNVEAMIGKDPNIVNFSGGQTTFFTGDFLEFYISASGYTAHLGDMAGLGEVMTLAEKFLTNKEDFMYFQMSTRNDFDVAMKRWMLSMVGPLD